MDSMSTIDQKMAEMKIKNMELLKRHQEIEQDRQLAQTVYSTNNEKKTTTMRNTTKNRTRIISNQQFVQEQHHHHQQKHERMHRPVMRRKFDQDRHESTDQYPQRTENHRLKRDRAQESSAMSSKTVTNHSDSIGPELLEYAYPFHHRTTNHHAEADEPASAKKLVLVNNKANRVGSGRFNQQERAQEHEQRRREERMRRCTTSNNSHSEGSNEFHLDLPPMPLWSNTSMPSAAPPNAHLPLLPTPLNGHHPPTEHLINTANETIEQAAFIPNFIYSSPVPTLPFHSNGTVYFAQAPPLMANPASQGPASLPAQQHFHPFHPSQTFENSNPNPFHSGPPPPTLPTPFHFAPPPPLLPPPPSSMTIASMGNFQSSAEDSPTDLPPRFRRLKDQDKRIAQSRPMSGDFDRFPSHSTTRFNSDSRSQSRPQSFYEFSSSLNHQGSFRSNPHHQRHAKSSNNNNTSLPLSAYMNPEDSSHWNTTSHFRRRTTNSNRVYHQDKHQFPLSLYDPRQYGFTSPNSTSKTNDDSADPDASNNDIDPIEEWWEDNHQEFIGTEPGSNRNHSQIDSQATTTTVNDSGNSSLSTSIHLKESTCDDEENNLSTNDFTSLPSDVSTTDSNIIESLDKLQQELKLEEALEKQLAAEETNSTDSLEKELALLNGEPTTYDTAHFMQWAKEKFREELAGRLTAQEIEQHDAVITDDDDDDFALPAVINASKINLEPFIDEDLDHPMEIIEDLKETLKNKLNLDENLLNPQQSIQLE